MTANNLNEAYAVVMSEPDPLPPQAVDAAFLITASELRSEKQDGGESTVCPVTPKPSAGWSS